MQQESGRQTGPAGWVVGTLAGTALAILGVGVALLLREKPGVTVPQANPTIPVHENHPPKYFGLPTYPTGFGFHSMVAPAGNSSSASYSVSSGTSSEVAAYYRKALESQGWKFVWQNSAKEQPGSPAGAKLAPAMGIRVHWQNLAEHRQLTLLSLDFPQKSSAGQVLLTWSPFPPGAVATPGK